MVCVFEVLTVMFFLSLLGNKNCVNKTSKINSKPDLHILNPA
jgi:hypothetical protein